MYFIFSYRKKREKPSTSKLIGQLLYLLKGVTTCASSNHLKDQTDDSIYSDIRECYLIGSSSVSSTCNLSTCFSKDYKHLQEIVERSSMQDMLTPTASRVNMKVASKNRKFIVAYNLKRVSPEIITVKKHPTIIHFSGE